MSKARKPKAKKKPVVKGAPAVSKPGQLTQRQRRFVDEYLIDLNGTQAAIRSGYSQKTANEQSTRLLANVHIQQYLAARMKAREERTEITQDYVLTTIRDTIERCKQASPVTYKNGDPVLVATPDGKIVPAYAFEPVAVLKGAELLGKHLKMFTDKLEHTGAGGGPIRQEITDAREFTEIAKQVAGEV